MASNYRQQIEKFKTSFDGDFGNVIEIGGGSNPTKVKCESYNNLEYPEFDLNKALPPIHASRGCYDTLFCWNVMEYVYDPCQAFRWFNQLLNGRTGILYVNFPYFYPHHDPKGMDYLRYTDDFIIKLCKIFNFEIIGLKEIESTPATKVFMNQIISNEGMHLRKDLRGHYTHPIGYILKARKK